MLHHLLIPHFPRTRESSSTVLHQHPILRERQLGGLRAGRLQLRRIGCENFSNLRHDRLSRLRGVMRLHDRMVRVARALLLLLLQLLRLDDGSGGRVYRVNWSGRVLGLHRVLPLVVLGELRVLRHVRVDLLLLLVVLWIDGLGLVVLGRLGRRAVDTAARRVLHVRGAERRGRFGLAPRDGRLGAKLHHRTVEIFRAHG